MSTCVVRVENDESPRLLRVAPRELLPRSLRITAHQHDHLEPVKESDHSEQRFDSFIKLSRRGAAIDVPRVGIPSDHLAGRDSGVFEENGEPLGGRVVILDA